MLEGAIKKLKKKIKKCSVKHSMLFIERHNMRDKGHRPWNSVVYCLNNVNLKKVKEAKRNAAKKLNKHFS